MVAIINRKNLEASVCRDSYVEFVKRFWHTVVTEKMIWNWHMEYLCQELQTLADNVFSGKTNEQDLIINISPGTSKSTIVTVLFPAWLWTRNQTAKSICGSYSYDLALDLSRKSRDVVVSDKYRDLFPDIELRDDQNAKGYFINKKGGFRVCCGVGGFITGWHGHFILIDDPINPKEAVSEAELKTVNAWIRETLPTRKVDKRIVPTVLIMQRLHQNDPSGHLLETRPDTIKHICIPAELTNDVRPRRLRKFYVNGIMDINRMPREVLEKQRADLLDGPYQSQFLQKPVPPGGTMFKIEMIRIVPAVRPTGIIFRYWDKAGTGGKGAFTVGTKMCRTGTGKDSRFAVMDVRRGQWEASEREKIIRQTAELDGKGVVVVVEQEPGSGGKESAQNTIRNLAGFRVVLDRPVGDKVLRADPYAVQVNSGNVEILRAEWNREYLNELQFFPNSRYKDQVDSSSGAFAKLTGFRRRVGAL